MASEELKPCPFCGSERVAVAGYDEEGWEMRFCWVLCLECEAEGPVECRGIRTPDNTGPAIRAWNRRAKEQSDD